MTRAAKVGSEALKRVQMDLPPKSIERLRKLQEITEASSYAEVIKNSLRLYEALIAEIEEGHEIMIKRGDNIAPMHVFAG